MPSSNPRARRSAQLIWTDARIRYVQRRWSRGASAAGIARELGGSPSRDAVLGMIRRLGLVGAAATRNPRTTRKHSHRGRLHVHSLASTPVRTHERRDPNSAYPPWVINAQPYAENPAVDANIPRAQRRALLDLDSHTCRWPIGDPAHAGFLFCGGEPVVGKPYCAAHCARAYRTQAQPTFHSRRQRGARRRRP